MRGVKAFYVPTTTGPSVPDAVRALIQLAGLGRVRPNVLAMGFKQDWWHGGGPERCAAVDEYVALIR